MSSEVEMAIFQLVSQLTEQNDLLRQQNELLQQLVNKQG